MAHEKANPRHDPRTLCRRLFDLAKRWWLAAMLGKIGVFVFGALVILLSLIPKPAPFIVAVLTLVSEMCLWRSDTIREMAETALRRLDYADSFGWSISRAEMSDLLARLPHSLRNRLLTQGLGEEYFASGEAVGPKRAVENIQESAWWSKHLAQRLGHFSLAITCLLAIGSIVVLIVSIETIASFDTLSSIARVVTSAIMLAFSLRLVRLTADYYAFASKASWIEEHAERLLDSETIDIVQAIKIVHEYQLGRASAPLIPTWMWKAARDSLNELWKEYRVRVPGDTPR